MRTTAHDQGGVLPSPGSSLGFCKEFGSPAEVRVRFNLRGAKPLLVDDAPFPEPWEGLRRRFTATFQWYHPGVRQQRGYIDRVVAYARDAD